MFGAGLVVIGVIFLLKNLGVIEGLAWDIVWPVVVIVIGATMIFKKK